MAICVCCLGTTGVRGAIRQAATCGQSDVKSALNSASDGDEVLVPSGHCTWTEHLTIAAGISFIGAGLDQTVIRDEVPDDGLIQLDTKGGKTYRVSGFTFARGDEGGWPKADKAAISVNGESKAWRVDHVKFDRLVNRGVRVTGWTYGVVDHCTFLLQGTQGMLVQHPNWEGHDWGDGSWAAPSYLGTEKAIYIEDNHFELVSGSNHTVVDCIQGGRFVFRHNTAINMNLADHGTESSGRQRSCRVHEIYDNSFTHPNGTWNRAINVRGGTGVVFDNSFNNFDNLAGLQNFRSFEPYSTWDGGCDGRSVYDVTDGVVYDSGTHDGGDGSERLLHDSSKSWKPDQWVGFQLIDLSQTYSDSARNGQITGNTSNEISVKSGGGNAPVLKINRGDRYEIRQVYPCIDQVGRGQGDLLSGNPANPEAWPHQVSDPMYFWGNTLNGRQATVDGGLNPIIEGRDFFNQPKPGYSPYVYPHPLVTEGEAAAPSAPANLRATSR